MTPRLLYAQGDVLIEKVTDVDSAGRDPVSPDPDGAVVLARGEVSGHRHAFYGGATLFRDDDLAQDMPSSLYVGHIRIAAPHATLVHEEHDAITLPTGTYRVRRQREYQDDTATRVIED